MPSIGKKKLRGIPELWDEVKKAVKMTLTPTAIEGLDQWAKKYGVSRSELVERIGRGVIPLPEPELEPESEPESSEDGDSKLELAA